MQTMAQGQVTTLVRAAQSNRNAIDFGYSDAWRLFDGEGDGIPGLFIDRLAGYWLIQTRDREFPRELVGLPDLGWRSLWWKRLEQEEKRPPRWMAGEVVGSPFVVRENGLSFEIDLAAGYSQGLFLDQRRNRATVRALARPGATVLNLFAYTCGFSVAAAAAGAVTTSLDLAQPSLEWGRRNFRHNGLDPETHWFCRGDAREWLERWSRSGRRFDAVVADPPTFSRTRRGSGVFRVERDYADLVAAALGVVSPGGGGWALFTTNCRSLSADDFRGHVEQGIRDSGRRAGSIEFLPMPEEYRGEPFLKSALVRSVSG